MSVIVSVAAFTIVFVFRDKTLCKRCLLHVWKDGIAGEVDIAESIEPLQEFRPRQVGASIGVQMATEVQKFGAGEPFRATEFGGNRGDVANV